MFLTSPRNSAVAHQSLFTKLECTTLLAPSPRPPFIAGILDAHPLKFVDVPSVAELLATEYPVFPYAKTYPEAAHDRLAILHTSGSTGIPKPIIWTHDSAVKHMHMQRLDTRRLRRPGQLGFRQAHVSVSASLPRKLFTIVAH